MKATSQTGQGLAEYAMILSLLAVVVIAVLAILGPAVGNIFSNVVDTLENRAAPEPGDPPEENLIMGVSAQRLGFEHANDVLVTVNVSASTSLTISDSQSGQSVTTACGGSCQMVLASVGQNAGTVTVTASGGGSATAGYIPKP